MEVNKQLEKDNSGRLKLIVSRNCKFEDFYDFAQKLEKKLNIHFKEKVDDFDSLYWGFEFKGVKLITSYDTFFGISIYLKSGQNESEKEKEILNDLMEVL